MFLLPLIVVLYVLGQGLALAARAVQPPVALQAIQEFGGIALVSLAALALELLPCFGAGLLRAAAEPTAVRREGAAWIEAVALRLAADGTHGRRVSPGPSTLAWRVPTPRTHREYRVRLPGQHTGEEEGV